MAHNLPTYQDLNHQR